MSILNGDIHSTLIKTLPDTFGSSMEELDYIPMNKGMEVVFQPDRAIAFAGSWNSLTAFRLEEDKLCEVSSLSLAGGVRQCALQGNLLAVTAREEGAYLIDISDPAAMKLLKRLDTLELATGVCLYDHFCLIANRHAGVEVWDVSSPQHPRYLSSFRCGEAQSVYMDRSCAYVGDWMNKKLWIFDLSTPAEPRKLSQIDVDGFADGVWVQDGRCYVAGGHNSRQLINRTAYWDQSYLTPQMLAEGFGCGHSLTCFDVSDPENPEFMSRLAFPPLFTCHPDTWRVTVSGQYAYVADTNNGVFAVDISDPFDMRIKAHRKLGLLAPDDNPLAPRYASASAAVPIHGAVLAVGPQTGLHLLAFPHAEPSAPPSFVPFETPRRPLSPFFSCEGQIHALVSFENMLVACCGDDGLYALDDSGKVVHHLASPYSVRDARVFRHFLLTAEGVGGVGVYLWDRDNGFRFQKRLRLQESSVRQLAVSDTLNALAMEIGTQWIGCAGELAQAIESEETLLAPQIFSVKGSLYDRHLVAEFYGDHFGAMPLTTGYTWFKLQNGSASEVPAACPHECCPIEEGVAAGPNLLYVVNRRSLYGLYDPCDPLDPSHRLEVAHAKLKGQPLLTGSRLLLLNRIHQTIECLDVTVPDHPAYLCTWELPGPPLHAIFHSGRLFAACGHSGIFELTD